MNVIFHLAVLILLGEFVNAQKHKHKGYCAGLSAANHIEPHRKCREACEKIMDCDYGYCRFFDGNPEPRCWCMDCKRKSKF